MEGAPAPWGCLAQGRRSTHRCWDHRRHCHCHPHLSSLPLPRTGMEIAMMLPCPSLKEPVVWFGLQELK